MGPWKANAVQGPVEEESEREAVAQAERDGAEIRLARQTMLERRVLEARFEENAARAGIELTAQEALEAKLRISLAVLQAKRCGRRALQEHLRLHAHIRVKAFFRKQPIRNRQTNRHRPQHLQQMLPTRQLGRLWHRVWPWSPVPRSWLSGPVLVQPGLWIQSQQLPQALSQRGQVRTFLQVQALWLSWLRLPQVLSLSLQALALSRALSGPREQHQTRRRPQRVLRLLRDLSDAFECFPAQKMFCSMVSLALLNAPSVEPPIR